jgi:hypothetical protein
MRSVKVMLKINETEVKLLVCIFLWYTVKKGFKFPAPSRDVTYQTLPGQE